MQRFSDDDKSTQNTIGSLFAKQSTSTSFCSAVSHEQLNKDFLIWFALDLEPFTMFNMFNNLGLEYFSARIFHNLTSPMNLSEDGMCY